MPELCRVRGIVIRTFPDDHPRPHFRAKYADSEAAIEIGSWHVTGNLPPARMRPTLTCAQERHVELMEAWDCLQRGELPGEIDP